MSGMNGTDGRGVAVVTGGTAGIGRATVRELAARGWDVAVLARGQERLDDTVQEVQDRGRRALGISVDVAGHAAVEAAADQVERELGPIELWVNNAFTGAIAFFQDIEPEEFERITAVTYLGYVNGTRAALRRMQPRDRGTIIQVGSALAFRGIPLQSPYCGCEGGDPELHRVVGRGAQASGLVGAALPGPHAGHEHAPVRLGAAPRHRAPPHARPADLPA
jgi:NAD(P)-dependent dehydrogenase (short-subunit alcohol dehydrogenase family)